MELYIKILLCLVITFFVSLIISPIIISIIKRQKIKQTILHYVESHQAKSGTPTMGGIIFIISICLVPIMFFTEYNNLAVMCLVVFLLYGIVGFLDDFIKVKFKRNLGLRAYQKIIFQLAISILISIYAYRSNMVGSTLILPFSGKLINFGWAVIPLNILVFLACTNSVNLTDGLDGLAAGTTLSYMFSFILLLFVLSSTAFAGYSQAFFTQLAGMQFVVAAAIGALICYLIFNCFPAKIFMGDTGSLALGALVAGLAIFTRTTLYLPILAIMFVASSVSVIMQVAYYKLTKKRIFLMAPLHHHFEKKGVHEVRITTSYMTVTLIVGLIVVLLEII